MNPLVSIIIPAYNREQLIGETLNSVLAQTYTNWECIVVDDGSVDNTEDVVTSYTKKDERFKFYHRPISNKKGASSCRNYGLSIAKGELIQFLDSDDLLAKNKFEAQIKCYEPHEFQVLTCKWGGFDESSNLSLRFKFNYHSYRSFKKGGDLLKTFGTYNEFFPLHVYLTNKNLIDKLNGWNEDLTNNDDAEFFTRVMLKASKVIFTPGTSVYYRYESINKLSEFNSEEKVLSAINSWKMIESHMKSKSTSAKNKYVKAGKLILFNAIIKDFPHIVAKEQAFFNDRKNYINKFNKILKRLGLTKLHF